MPEISYSNNFNDYEETQNVNNKYPPNISVFTRAYTHVQCSPLNNALILRSLTTIDGIFTWIYHKRTNLIVDKGIFSAASLHRFWNVSEEIHKRLNNNTWTSNYTNSSQNSYFIIPIFGNHIAVRNRTAIHRLFC